MKKVIGQTYFSLVLVILFSTSAFCEETLRIIDWQAAKASGELLGGEVITSDNGSSQLKVEIPPAGGTAKILRLENPGITSNTYALVGIISYKDIKAPGYLEMWNEFPVGTKFFTRTLAEKGPMTAISGLASKRTIVLPFYLSNQGENKPEKPKALALNLMLPAGGKVFLEEFKLLQYAPGENPLAAPVAQGGAWWSDQAAGMIGGIGGAIIGLLGALLGILVPMGKARSFVLFLMPALSILGFVSLGVGAFAYSISQPYVVYYPLLLAGAICAAVFGFGTAGARKNYQTLELRKMQSLDLNEG